MFLMLLLCSMLGVLRKDPYLVLDGLGFVLMAATLQYAAARSLGALDRLNRSTPGRVPSAAFLDCFGLLNMAGGLVILVWLALEAVRTEQYFTIVPAIAAFIVCQYSAVVAFNPDAIHLTIAPEASAGEEAVGIVSFLLKVMARQAAVVFGVGVAWGMVLVCHAYYLMLRPPDSWLREEVRLLCAQADALAILAKYQPAFDMAWHAAELILWSAAVPLLCYCVFLINQLSLELARAVLALPGKLDKLSDESKR